MSEQLPNSSTNPSNSQTPQPPVIEPIPDISSSPQSPDSQPSHTTHSGLPPYRTPNKALLFLPWALLLLLLLAGFWALTHGKFNLGSSSTPTTTTTQWQPPKPNPVPTETLKNQKDVVSYHDAVAVAAQSVVNIYTDQKVAQHPYMNDPALKRFFEQHGGLPEMENDNTSLGSGVIVSQDGFIVTNAHVIAKADDIVVMLNDGRKATAKLIGSDPESDLAVIKVELTGLKPLGFKDKPSQVGDVVLAIGNPFGVGQTVTQGIISATGRSGLGINTVEDFIQTDAAINPGNSGGALVDAYGQMVGINTAIFSRSGGSMGIGFAIPTDIIEYVMKSLIKEGKVRRGWLGIELQSIEKNPTNLDASQGVEVVGVLKEGPAAKSGMQKGDVILSMDGKPINDANTLIQLVARKSPNSIINLTVKRGGSQSNLAVTLGERQPQEALSPQYESQLPSDNTPFNAKPNGNGEEEIPQELLDLLKRQ